MSEKKCSTCRFFDAFTGVEASDYADTAYDGLCRRHAPRCTDSGDGAPRWPLVEVTYDWCGEYQEEPA